MYDRFIILKRYLKREDAIDINGKLIERKIQLEAEDIINEETIKNRLIIMKICEFNDINYEENNVYINISNGAKSNYEGAPKEALHIDKKYKIYCK